MMSLGSDSGSWATVELLGVGTFDKLDVGTFDTLDVGTFDTLDGGAVDVVGSVLLSVVLPWVLERVPITALSQGLQLKGLVRRLAISEA
jgi:hypothetical protein